MLWEQVQARWMDIDQRCINKLSDGMPVRVEAARKMRGEVTRF
jgi:hypothetical protein